MEDVKDVQTGEVSEGATSTEAETKAEEKQEQPQPQFLTKEDVKKILAEEREKIRQSARDISKSEIDKAQGEARYYKTLASGLETGFGQENPEGAEVAKLKAKLAAKEQAEFEAAQARNREKFDADFRKSQTQILTSMGVDPNDERIDWAEDATGDYLARNVRILESATKISQEVAKSEKEKLEQRLKDIESKLGEEANSVDTSASGGATGSDKDFLASWGSGELPATKENLMRAQKLQNKE